MEDRNFLQDDLKRTALQRQESPSRTYDYQKKARPKIEDYHEESKEKAQETYFHENMSGDMGLALDELTKNSKRKKKKSPQRMAPEYAAVNEEFMKLEEEIKQRTRNRRPSLYGADGGVDDDGRARLETMKKDILKEIRGKIIGRKISSKSSHDDSGLLGSTKSNLLEEIKMRSKKKKKKSSSRSDSRRPSGVGRSDRSAAVLRRPSIDSRSHREAGQEDEGSRGLSGDTRIHRCEAIGQRNERRSSESRSPVPSSWGMESLVHQAESLMHDSSESLMHESEGDMQPDDLADKEPDKPAYFVEQLLGRSTSSFQDEVVKALHSPVDEDNQPMYKPNGHRKSRSRSLMYKYGNYSTTELSSLPQEQQNRVAQQAPRAHVRHTRRQSMNDFTISDSSSSLNDHTKNRMRLDDGSRRKPSRRNTGGSYYIPGITGKKPRALEDTDHTAIETQQEAPDSEFNSSASSFFIPGITGPANFFNSAEHIDRARSLQISTLSASSGGSDDSSGGARGGASRSRRTSARGHRSKG